MLAADKEFVFCRESVRVEGAWGDGDASGHAQGLRARLEAVGARAQAERTKNMLPMPISMLLMSLTLDVSKLSGWLNAYATCRVERRACDTGRGTAREAGGRWVAATQARHAQGLRVRLEAVGARAHAVGAHREHGPHVRDAGRVEAERLVELLRALPRSRTAGMRFTARCGPEGVRALGWLRHNRRARGGTDSQGCGSQRARVERTLSIRYIFVTLDVSKLSGWLNLATPCRVERRACDAGSGIGPGGREGVAWVAAMQAACTGGWPGSRLWGQGTRGAHIEHPLHIRDAGRVEAERLVERVRTLPSQKVGMRCGKRCGPGGVRALCVAATQSACTGRARLKAGGARARAERTQNIDNMVVTLDVSKLSGWLNALASCRVERRACDAGRGAAREA